MNPVTLLVLDEFPGVGGAQRVALDLHRRLDRRRWTPVLAGPPGGRFEEEVRSAGLRFEPLDLYTRKRDWYRVYPALAAEAAVARLVAEVDARLIHANSLWTLQFAGPAAARRKLPVVVTAHAFPRPRSAAKRLLLRTALHRSLGPVRAVAAVSEVLRRALAEAGVPDRLLRVVPNGVDTRVYHPDVPGRVEIRRELGLREDEPAVVLPGRIHPGKGHRVLLQAARILAEGEGRMRFFAVGEEISTELERLDFADELAREIQEADLEDRFRLLGYRQDLPAVLAAMDVVCLPSYEETFGMAVLEGMALGKPVVASRVGGLPELVEHQRTGLLVPPGNPEALAAALDQLAREPRQAEAMGRAAAETARTRFPVEASLAALEALFRGALGRNG